MIVENDKDEAVVIQLNNNEKLRIVMNGSNIQVTFNVADDAEDGHRIYVDEDEDEDGQFVRVSCWHGEE